MALTYNWNTISADQCDADSPIDEILMESIRQNQIHLKEWIGKDYTAVENHDHNGVNSKTIVASIGRNELKTATQEVALTAGQGYETVTGTFVLSGGEYGFYPRFKIGRTGYITEWTANWPIIEGSQPTSYTAYISLSLTHNPDNGSDTLYGQQRYITASGTEHWLFLICDKKEKQIISSWSSPDHPCYGNGGNAEKIPHPFADYHNSPLSENLEIILLDMESTNRIRTLAKDNNKTVLELVHDMQENGNFEIEMTKEVRWQPRDMDGKLKLEKKHSSYTLRKMTWRKKWNLKRKTKNKS